MNRILIAILVLAAPLVGAAEPAPDVAALKARIAQLEKELAELKQTSIPMAALADEDVGLEIKGFLDLHDKDKPKAPVPPLVAKLLNLSDQDVAQIGKLKETAIAGMTALLPTVGIKTEAVDRGVKLRVPDFSSAAAPLRDAYEKGLTELLGADRRTLLKKLEQRGEDESVLLDWGRYVRTITVRLSDEEQFRSRGKPSYSWEILVKRDGGDRSSSGSTSPELPPELRLLKPFLPATLGGPGPAAPPAKPDKFEPDGF